MSVYQAPEAAGSIRVLFCFGVTEAFCEAPRAEYEAIGRGIFEAFDGLQERFGVTVLGTLDDDLLLMGASHSWPWSCYILCDAPDLRAVTEITNIVRDRAFADGNLWRYLKVEARVGRPLFFGNR